MPAFPAYQDESVQAPGSPPQSVKPHYVYADEEFSMEEKRAQLEKYTYDRAEERLKADRFDKLIESRLASMRNTFGKP